MANDKCNIKLIVGLGNPGSEYEHTRHNIGVDFLYKLADKYRIDMRPDNGLRSITANLSNSQNYYRLRLGIGKPPSHEVINWVLGKPSANDKKLIDDAYEEALLAIDKLFTDGVSKATSMINGYKPN